MWVMPLVAAVTGVVCAGLLFRAYFVERQPALLAWSVSLAILVVAAVSAFIGSADGWNEFTAKVYYLSEAALFASYMGLGAVYFNTLRIIGHVWLAVLLLATVVAALLLARAGIDDNAFTGTLEPGWRAVEAGNLLTGVVVALNSIGTIILVTTAVYGIVYRRAGFAQVLVAAGVLLVALAGSLARLDDWEWLFIAQLPGMLMIFLGAMMAGRSIHDRVPGHH